MRIGLEFQFDQISSLFSILKDQGVRQRAIYGFCILTQ